MQIPYTVFCKKWPESSTKAIWGYTGGGGGEVEFNSDMNIIYKSKEVVSYLMRKVFAALSSWARFFEKDVAKQQKVQEESLRKFEQRKKTKMVSDL